MALPFGVYTFGRMHAGAGKVCSRNGAPSSTDGLRSLRVHLRSDCNADLQGGSERTECCTCDHRSNATDRTTPEAIRVLIVRDVTMKVVNSFPADGSGLSHAFRPGPVAAAEPIPSIIAAALHSLSRQRFSIPTKNQFVLV